MFSRSRQSRGEEEQLLGGHELAPRSAISPSPSLLSRETVSPQPTSPMSISTQQPHYRGAYETLGRRQSLAERRPLAAETPTVVELASPFTQNSGFLDQRSTVINDPFTGEPEGTMSPDHQTPANTWPMFEGCADVGLQDRFWTHVAKIRELQTEVAKMHIAMESIGQPPPAPATKEKEKPKEQRKGRANTRAGTTSNTDRDETGHSASDTDHAGSGRDSRSGTKKTTHAEPPVTTDTGEHFVERKEAIQNIMKKLTALSQQVTEFHQLPPPEITFPTSPSRQTQAPPLPQTPPHPPTLAVPSPTHPHGHQTPRSKVAHIQRHSPLGPQGQYVPHISIPDGPLSGIHSQPATPSKVATRSMISGDGTLHESPASVQQASHA